MKFLVYLLLIGFISLSVFGFVGMLQSYDDMAHAPSTCLASLAQNGACPPPENTIASALFHTNAFKVFSTTLLSAVFALAALAFLYGVSVVSLQAMLSKNEWTLFGKVEQIISRYLALKKLRLALVRFEHSPTSL
jgi:hypothetical protein